MSIILFLVILVVLVIAHELGHFLAAKKSGIRVDEFGFGFPPKLFGVKRGETEYTFNALPFGGFVKIFGENPQEEGASQSKRSFIRKPKYIQAIVLAAGVFFNLVLAWLLLSVGFIGGMPSSVEAAPRGTVVQNPALTVTNVLPQSPAERAGISVGDIVNSVSEDEEKIKNPTPEELQSFVSARGGKEIKLEIKRGKEDLSLNVVPEVGIIEGEDVAAIGIAMDMVGIVELAPHRAVWEGLKSTVNLTGATAVALATLVRDAVLGQADIKALTGPVGIVGLVGNAFKIGFIYLLTFTAFISINLAIINLIPFPALDGGRLLFLLIEYIKGSPMNPRIANALNAAGFFLLILLMIIVTYHDIVRIFSP